MTHLVFHHDYTQLPPTSETVLPVQMYGISGRSRGDTFAIGSPVVERIKRLGVPLLPQVLDFLSIALSVTAVDTFVQRKNAADGWTRQLSIELPLCEPDRWNPLKKQLQKALHFLSGDMWEYSFTGGGPPPPEPFDRRHKLISLDEIDCVCLFSGGLDSAVGAIDLLVNGHSPLLVSHAYRGDRTYQNEIAKLLKGRYSRLSINAHPVAADGQTDTSMRTRSIGFLAFGAVGASAVQTISRKKRIDLFVPENGFISLNAPLTPRRIGSLSTRTTHPYFIGLIQDIFDQAEIPCVIRNPYQFKTKGEMINDCRDRNLLARIVDSTVSCSHWKRGRQQCGVCVPCLVRRSALHACGIQEEPATYKFRNLADVLQHPDKRDDLMALSIAIEQKASHKFGPWVSDSGPLPSDQYQEFQRVFSRGLDEVKAYLEASRIL